MEDQSNDQQKVLFIDEFDSFNSSSWTKETHAPGWTNQELQSYDAAHVSIGVDDGKSVLIITAERKGDRIISGRVNSKGKVKFRYGKLEASIKLPKTANGLWPAFWMMGDNDKNWPQCGEIDIMEMGERGGIENNSTETQVNTAIHYGVNNSDGHRQQYYTGNSDQSLQDGKYHLYKMEWDPETITIYIDGVRFHCFDISNKSDRYDYFRDEFYILFNLAVGGSFTGIYDPAEITALKDGEKKSMYIDWVKISN